MTGPTAVSVPMATRARRPGWRDPRILLGIAIMAASVLAGAWLTRSTDDSAPVLVVRRDLPAGATLTGADVSTHRVRLGGDLADRYLVDLPAEATLDRPVRAGELLPRSSVTDAATDDQVEVPLSVSTDDLPATVERGSVVDVWAVPDPEHGGRAGGRARLVLQRVTVLALADRTDTLAPQSTRQVIVTVPAADADQLATALGRTTSGRLVLTRRS